MISHLPPDCLPPLGPSRVLVAVDTVLDARLALYHRVERWLAVADLHYGYELSQRAAGALFPLWGMANIERRLLALIEDYRPRQLIVAGDFVHNRSARQEAGSLAERLRVALGSEAELILVAGNHDRRSFAPGELRECYQTERFCFYHGDVPLAPSASAGGKISVIGHHHPARTIGDGAGFSTKLPAFVQTDEHWVLPAFSPWAAGGSGWFGTNPLHWLCGEKRILPPLPGVLHRTSGGN